MFKYGERVMGKIVGRIVEVKGLQVRAKLFNLLPPYLVENGKRESAPKINGFVKTKIGIDTIICQVVGEYSEEIGNNVKSHFLDLQVKGYLDKNKFIQGLRILPIVSANIELLDKDDYENIYNSGSPSTIFIGNDLFDENKGINVEINKLIPSHIGVFGNTGSGKSNTLTKILQEYTNILNKYRTKNGKYLILDLNNEYGKSAICKETEKTIYSLSTGKKSSSKKIPLNLNSLSEDDFIVLMNASQKTQAPVVKNAYKEMKKDEEERRGKDYYLNYLKVIIKNSRKSLFHSMRVYLKDYFTGLDGFIFNSTKGEFYYKNLDGSIVYCNKDEFDNALEDIDVILPEDSLDRFLFELYFSVAHENENGVNLDFMMPLIARARKLINDFRKIFDFTEEFKDIFDDKNICIVQLGNVNRDMKEIVPSIITNNIFNRLVEKKEEGEIKQIINIVVDEAHNILYEDNKNILSHESVLDVFEKVVKEGRKFGLFLMLASQRPSDISQTIISQLHNYFIHKLVNPSDILKIRKAVAYMDDASLDFITILAPGECIVSGTAFQMPTFLYVKQVSKESRPNSENVVLIGENGLLNNKEEEI